METGVKQERFDETEIQNLADKMMEANKVRMSTPAPLSQVQTIQHNGTIFNFLTPSKDITVTKIIKSNNVTNLKDDESLRGHFGWTTVNKALIPYIIREGQKLCSVRVVEMKVLNKFLHCFNQEIYKCACVKSFYVTEAELRLLNEINVQHCDLQFGDQFTPLDLVVRLDDVIELHNFLETCYSKLLMKNKGITDRCGFVRINKESVVPYSVSAGEKYVPQFYFEDESDSLKLNIDQLEGWDLAYLKFCCKLQGIREELFSKDACAVISLNNIKSYFPPGTSFEDCWPSKIVGSQLLSKGKTQMVQVGQWTNRPTEPPIQIHPSNYGPRAIRPANILPNVQILHTPRGGGRRRQVPMAIQPNIIRAAMGPIFPTATIMNPQFRPITYGNIAQLPPPRNSSNITGYG
uniref:Uncharacterized protein n=1 Tax=Photinus pyralis TaxID=7054 RepID=A0A1Y1KKV2_PHOPY